MIPTLALLTGINTEDNVEQFSTLAREIQNDITPHVAVLSAQDCTSVKALMENTVSQFVNPDNDSVRMFLFNTFNMCVYCITNVADPKSIKTCR